MPATPDNGVIAALATAAGASALSVIRVSGGGAIALVDRLFEGRRKLADLSGFEGAHGRIRRDAEILDEVVAWVYLSPHTFTGEDLVEISCHGGNAAPHVLEALFATGARPAGPGEFTRRAFLNGRLDLAQAEAVADLVSARGALARRQALFQLEGGLSRRVKEIAREVRNILARITVFLDFEEDEPGPPDTAALLAALAEARGRLDALVASHLPSRRIREGATIALVGRPNVGKSSLLNAMVGRDRALVHEEPGTTRDAVDVTVEWGEIPVRLVDTAGIRDSDGAVERAGIERSRREAAAADLLLWVVDGSVAPTGEDLAVAAEANGTPVVLAMNKSDLGERSIEWVNRNSPTEKYAVSARTMHGVPALIDALRTAITRDVVSRDEPEPLWITNARHANLLREGMEALDRGALALGSGFPAELAAADLHACLDSLAAITGDQAGPDLLDTIFSRFCIGK